MIVVREKLTLMGIRVLKKPYQIIATKKEVHPPFPKSSNQYTIPVPHPQLIRDQRPILSPFMSST
jgi:hypothetical protein